MDPLSVTTGVFSLIGVCFKVGVSLRDFCDQVGSVRGTLRDMRHDIETLSVVLNSMKDTFESAAQPTTGHIGAHWENIARSLADGLETLSALDEVVIKTTKDVAFLDGPRKQIRLNSADTKIATYGKRVQTFRDTMQLSLQTVMLWNQVSMQGYAERIIPSLEDIHRDIKRLATGINSRLQALEDTVAGASDEEATDQQRETAVASNLRHCVRSAATIVSSASTILAREFSYAGSEFGDLMSPNSSEMTMAWLATSQLAINDTEEEAAVLTASEPAGSRQIVSYLTKTSAAASDHSDSDSDLDTELIAGLLAKGRKKLAAKEYEGASKLFRNCLSRIPGSSGNEASPSRMRVSKLEVLALLCDTYVKMKNWDDAQLAAMEKISLRPQESAINDYSGLTDIFILSSILYQKQDYVQAQLYARKALRGYRRLGSPGESAVESTLILLVEVCRAAGNTDQSEAYSVMLENVLETKATNAAPEDNILQAAVEQAIPQDEGETPRGDMPNMPARPRAMTPPQVNSEELESTEIYGLEITALGPPISTVDGNESGPNDEPLRTGILRTYHGLGYPSRSKTTHKKKLVIVGDGLTGKSLLLAHQAKKFVAYDHEAAHSRQFGIKDWVIGPFSSTIELDDCTVDFTMFDSEGQEDYDHIRPSYYPGTDVVLIMFSKASPTSLDNVWEKWISEVRHFLPEALGVPIILVGNKKDLETDREVVGELRKTSEMPVIYNEGKEMAKKVGATYMECSAFTGEGIKELFETAAKASLVTHVKPKKNGLQRLFGR